LFCEYVGRARGALDGHYYLEHRSAVELDYDEYLYIRILKLVRTLEQRKIELKGKLEL